MSDSPQPVPDTEDEARTGLAWLSSWSAVYRVVLVVFVIVVLAMWGFEVYYG